MYHKLENSLLTHSYFDHDIYILPSKLQLYRGLFHPTLMNKPLASIQKWALTAEECLYWAKTNA